MPEARHVHTSNNGTLHKYDPEDGTEIWSSEFTSWTGGDAPVAANDNGEVWVGEPGEGKVTKYDSSSSFSGSFDVYLQGEISAMCADNSGDVYVGGTYGEIRRFNGYGYREEIYYATDEEIYDIVWLGSDYAYVTGDPEVALAQGSNYYESDGTYVKQYDYEGASRNWIRSVSNVVGLGSDGLGVYAATTSTDGFDALDTDGNTRFSKSGASTIEGLATGDSYTVTLNDPPTADFTFTKNGGTVDFTDASSDPDGSISSWSWDFGDGTTSTSQSPSHTYGSSGTYTVTLTVTDGAGGTGSTSQDVSVTVSTTITGTTALTDKKTSLSLSGQIITKITGALSITDQGPATAASGSVSNDGSAALTDQSTGLSAAGDLPLSSSLTVSTGQETASSSGQVANGGSLGFTDEKSFIKLTQKPLTGVETIVSSDIYAPVVTKIDASTGQKVWSATSIGYNDGYDNAYPNSVACDESGNVYTVVEKRDGGNLQGSEIQRLNDTVTEYAGGYAFVEVDALPPSATADVVVAAEEGDSGDVPVDVITYYYENLAFYRQNSTRLPVDTRITGIDIDKDGNVFLASKADDVFALDSAMNLLWHNTNGGRRVAVTDSKVYAATLDSINRIDKSSGTTGWTEASDVEFSINAGRSGTEIVANIAGDYARLEDNGSGLTTTWTRTFGYSNLHDVMIDNTRSVYAGGDEGADTNSYLERATKDGQLVRYSESPGTQADRFETAYQRPMIRSTVALTDEGEALTGTLSAVAGAKATITSSGETFDGSGAPFISGAGDFAHSKEFVNTAGVVLAVGGGSFIDTSAHPTVEGTPIASVGGGFTDVAQTLAASGGPIASGPSDLLNEAPTLALVGAAVARGGADVSGGKETLFLLGAPTAAGSGALTNRSIAPAGTGLITVSGGGSATDAGELLAIVGDIYAGGSGTMAFTDGQTTVTADGDVCATGESAVTDAGQSLSGNGAALLSGTVSATDQGHALALTGDVLAQGAGSLAEKPTILLLNGGVLSRGNSSLTLVDGLQSVSIGGGPIAGGATSLEDRPGPFASQGEVLAASTLAVADEAYAPNGAGFVRASGSLRAGNPPNTTEGTGAVLTSGALSTEGGAPIITIATFVGRKPDSISIGVGSIISIDTDVQSSL